jgi:low affinity Fe/Cu permease
MARKTRGGIGATFERISSAVTAWTGSTSAFTIALGVVVVWGLTGPLFHYSDTWQLVINTGTTIVTFLMVFLIQRTQNKDSLALQLKLNELVAAIEGASNRLIDVEDLDEKELKALHEYYGRLAIMAKKEAVLTESHSIEEAEARHSSKVAQRRKSRSTREQK